jgi:trehalose-phosphatase
MRSFNDKLAERIALTPKVFFFFDYDGTLTPIVSRPERAMLKPAMKSILLQLSRFQRVRVAVISGRSLLDLQRMAGSIPGITYVGNHGLEMKGEGFIWSHPSVKQASRIMTDLWAELRQNLRSVQGMLLENKTLGISLHYRLVPEKKIADLYRNFQKIVAPWVRLGTIKVHEGKKVWEIRLRQHLWDKGKAVRWLLKKYRSEGRFLPVFLGDDRTDEDAFKALQHGGITVKVSENPRAISAAKYYIHSPAEVLDFLEQVIKLRRAHLRRVHP